MAEPNGSARAAELTVPFDLYPAIDLLGGRCVRLYQGDYERETIYGDDPVAQAGLFVADGASWLHVVDLDAAKTGEPTNREVIGRIAESSTVPVQVGGGVRDRAAAEALFDLGVRRVVIGTAALERPELVEELVADGRSIAVGIDARGDEVATHGWIERSGTTTVEVATRYAAIGVEALVVTEIGRDGTMEGPDVEGLGVLLEAVDGASSGSGGTAVIASGGVGTLDDVVALAEMNAAERSLAGVIVGRALYEGAFTLAAAIERVS